MEDAAARSQRTQESTSVFPDHPEKHDEEEKGIETSLLQQLRRAKLSSLQIPVRTLESSSSFLRLDSPSTSSASSSRGGLPPRPNLVKTKSSVRSLLSHKSFGAKRSFPDGDMITPILPEVQRANRCPDKPTPLRSFSLSRLLITSSTKATHSLPTTPISNSDTETLKATNMECQPDFLKTEAKQQIARSLSAPLNVKPRVLRRLDSVGLIRIVSAGPQYPGAGDASVSQTKEIESEPPGDDIPEDEAVCRICLLELVEGGDILKMECSCKGDLALAHKECAIKWFSIKVTLQQREANRYRIWQNIPVLVLVSMLAYFCFLEQLLVPDMGPRALAISLPFSCVLGLLSSMTVSTMASRAYIWAYACFQFAIVILFAHVYYAILNVNAVLSVFLSAITGLGLTVSIKSLLIEYLKWRRRRQLRPANQQTGTRSWPQVQQQPYDIDNHYHQQHEQRLQQECHQPHSQQQAIENQNMGSSESYQSARNNDSETTAH
ncbi:uncharacterized protein LOC120085906 isoform X2 [Benincasa hispida]|uniref:uncharacterized protein LOC120085906 isoform X2 n=1 Tax=Benincasa hispida TaxID=102211 RepID=UPI0018FF5186|nr:uncharacterized protein LOC120085906 isoform X2 [Benincasa hispida]